MKNRSKLKSLLKLAREQPQAFTIPRDQAVSDAWSDEWDRAWDKANEDANVGSHGRRKVKCNQLWDVLEKTSVNRALGYEPLRDMILALCAYDDLGWVLVLPAQDALNLYEMGAKQDTRLLLVLPTLRALAQMQTKENDDEESTTAASSRTACGAVSQR